MSMSIRTSLTTLVLEALQDRDAFEKPVTMDLPGTKTLLKESTSVTPVPVTSSHIRDGIRMQQAEVTISKSLPPTVKNNESAIKPSPVFRESPIQPTGYAVSASVPQIRSAHDAAPVIPEPAVQNPQTVYSEEKAEQVSTILPEISKPLKILGALFNTYILIEYENTLLMIDQHAVHERLLFDRLIQEHQQQNIGQELLVPYVISLTQKEKDLLEENRDELESIGLTADSFGEKDVAIRTIPMVLGEAETAGFVKDILSDLEAGRGLTFEKKRAELLQTACKHAIKGGEELTEDQLRSLVTEMIEKKVTPTCPHGRPLVVAITRRDLDKKFKRIQ